MIILQLFKFACDLEHPETPRVDNVTVVGTFVDADWDKAMASAMSYWDSVKASTITCPTDPITTSPQYHLDAFWISPDNKYSRMIFEDGEATPDQWYKIVLYRRSSGAEPCSTSSVSVGYDEPGMEGDRPAYEKSADRVLAPYGQASVLCGAAQISEYEVYVYEMRKAVVTQPVYHNDSLSMPKPATKKTGAEDETPASGAAASPSGWQVVGAVALAGLVGYASYRLANHIMERRT